jgi:TolB-like protein
VQKIGEELRVRYALKGNVRRFGSTLWVNVQLISAETGAHLWSDRFDEGIGELAAGQEQVVRLKDEVGTRQNAGGLWLALSGFLAICPTRRI